MILHIKKEGLLSDIQKEFSNYFPYLRIDFFRLPHGEKKLSPKNEKLNRFTPISQLVTSTEDESLEINEKMTIGHFEALMEKQAGLFIQVFRKSGRVWIETSFTDDWTLELQNEEGKMMSSIHDISSESQND